MRACVICVHAWACNELRKATATTAKQKNATTAKQPQQEYYDEIKLKKIWI